MQKDPNDKPASTEYQTQPLLIQNIAFCLSQITFINIALKGENVISSNIFFLHPFLKKGLCNPV